MNFIIRPPRAEYDPTNDLLDDEFMLKGKWFQRKDLKLKNSRGDVLQCSHYVPIVSPEGKAMPCVIYCHGNSGCRADASEAAIILLPSNITVFAIDFSGSGLSGGEHVTLGCNEKDDLKVVVDYLRADGNVSLIGLWGRSMGAVTSLMYGAEDPSIAGMVLDSPFSDLVDLMMELVDTYKFPLPKFTVKFAIQYMRKAIQKKAKFDIMDLNTIKVAKSCFVPVLLGHATDDDFIRPHHSERIYDAYVGDKNIIKFEGDHNSPRPQFYFDSINIFFHNVLQPPEDEVAGTFYDSMHDYFGRGSWNTLHTDGSSLATSEAGPESSSTEDAIKQLRSKRPMSRTDVPSACPTEDKLPGMKEKRTGNDPASSPSNMISFELSNGHPCDPQVSAVIDDDQYVEYQLDDLAGFPCNVEEEERMIMEAMLASLKDMEMRQPRREEPTSTVSNNSLEPLHKDASSSSIPESSSPQKTELMPSISTHSRGPATEAAPSLVEPVTTGVSSCSNTVDMESSSNTDMSSGTKATVTVVKSQASHGSDSLWRKWDLNFFRNGR